MRIGRCPRAPEALVILLTLCASAGSAAGRLPLTPSMVVNESEVGDPTVLVDEQDLVGDPPRGSPETRWAVGGQHYGKFPLRAYVDLGTVRHLSAIWLYDSNGVGDFRVSYGSPGEWTELFTDDCGTYKKWQPHTAEVSTRYLRFAMLHPQAIVAEVAVYEQTEQEHQAMLRERRLMAAAIEEARNRPLVDAGEPFGELRLVDEVRCGDRGDDHLFAESPASASKVETILGRPCRVLPNAGEAKFFAYRIGRRKLLEPGAAYVLTVEYPEDRPRTLFIQNRGAEYARGFSTGAALGDVLYTHTDNNCESLDLPLSGEFRTWRTLFFLHDRFPDLALPRGAGPRPLVPRDGFWVVVTQSQAANAPLSNGAAVARIRLFEAGEPAAFNVELNLPPEGLPRRHLFWREEMSDGVIISRNEQERGVSDDTDWYEQKARLMQFLGMRTYCKDLLEFGHNQGWYCGDSDEWYNRSKHPDRWRRQLDMLGKYGFDVLPYYEYAGSVGKRGVGRRIGCETLGGAKDYTHITWSEKFHADITDHDVLADAKRLLEATIVRHKDRVNFLGAWFRIRPSHIPMSFSDRCLARFAKETAVAAPATRERLRDDADLLARYYTWWLGKRRDFLIELRDYLRSSGVNPNAVILFTAHAAEPGPSLPGWGKRIVTDDVARWTAPLASPEHAKVSAIDYGHVLRDDLHLQAALSPPKTWGDWEWQHSCPQADPASYADTDGVLMTYPFNRAYTVSSPKALGAFRTRSGLAALRHGPLNENTMHEELGYFVSDVELAGPFCMLAEARAVAYGDPRYIGYLSSSSFNRGFPEYVRAFNAAFLALPALPSEIVDDASPDPDIVVRAIATEDHGTYVAIVNV
ncbi:MAG: hypothetical protein PVH68_06120, partial [Armatimonadota bacterium]